MAVEWSLPAGGCFRTARGTEEGRTLRSWQYVLWPGGRAVLMTTMRKALLQGVDPPDGNGESHPPGVRPSGYHLRMKRNGLAPRGQRGIVPKPYLTPF